MEMILSTLFLLTKWPKYRIVKSESHFLLVMVPVENIPGGMILKGILTFITYFSYAFISNWELKIIEETLPSVALPRVRLNNENSGLANLELIATSRCGEKTIGIIGNVLDTDRMMECDSKFM
tara:strand:+ start:283 stop:651 length:369 start_codon:yes stop_codon:yes gene_type:complete